MAQVMQEMLVISKLSLVCARELTQLTLIAQLSD